MSKDLEYLRTNTQQFNNKIKKIFENKKSKKTLVYKALLYHNFLVK